MFTAMWAAATGSFREIAMDWELPEGEISSSPFSSSSEDKDTLRVGRAPTTFAARSAASPSTGSKGTSKKTGHKGHAWANKFKGGLKKRRFGHAGEHLPANTAFDHDNINLQRLDSLPVTKKKGNPKSLTQMKKKSLQKPSKKMDKMYKKMLEKQRLQKKREKYEKLHKKTKKQVP